MADCISSYSIASFFWTDSNTVNQKVCRETIPYSGNTKKELNATPIAKRVEKLVTEAMNADPAMRSPPMDLITYIMADSLLKTTPYTKNKPRLDVYFESQAYKIRREKGIFLDAYTEAIDILRAEKRDWEAVRKELQTCSPVSIPNSISALHRRSGLEGGSESLLSLRTRKFQSWIEDADSRA